MGETIQLLCHGSVHCDEHYSFTGIALRSNFDSLFLLIGCHYIDICRNTQPASNRNNQFQHEAGFEHVE